MIRETIISRSVRLICSGGMALGVGLLGHAALAQEASSGTTQGTGATQRVEITGSSIKRIAQEGAVPVQILTSEDIKKSGAQTVTDLIQASPAMQGFTVSADSVNGGGGGVTTASLRSLGSSYTLVLLNGKRIAPVYSDSTVNLQNLPLSAVERVEVLTDGASAIYGADAIAGVVNFILKKNVTEGEFSATYTKPQHPGGQSYNAGISKGFGDLDKDGWNVFLSYSHDHQSELNAPQRDFARSGRVFFEQDGQKYALSIDSGNSVPANATPRDANRKPLTSTFNPYFMQNGTCPPNTFLSGKTCRFDYSSTVELVAEGQHDTFFGSGHLRVNDALNFSADALYSKSEMLPRYAPPAQPLVFSTSNPAQNALIQQYVAPYVTQLGGDASKISSVALGVRVFDAGGRKDKYSYEAKHLVLGMDGSAANWDYNASYTYSNNYSVNRAIGGYLSSNKFFDLIDKGVYNPFLPAGSSVAALAPAVLNEDGSFTTSRLDVVNLRASRPLFALTGGDVSLGLGFDYMKQHYKTDYAPIVMGQNALQPNYTDSVIGGAGGLLPGDASRHSEATFAEMLFPITKELEVTGALRRDQYSAVTNDRAFDIDGNPVGSGTQGKSSAANTYKLSVRYQPVSSLLLRASYGTGFRAPSLNNVVAPISSAGNTSREYDCPFKAPDPLAAGCFPYKTEYDVLSGGNPSTGDSALRPEKSKQWTVGFRVEPSAMLSLGIDFWNIDLTDQISTIPQSVAFGNPQAWRGLFSVIKDPISGDPTLAVLSAPVNLSKSSYRGIDVDAIGKYATPVGKLTLRGAATYMMKADYTLPDVDDNGNLIQTVHSSLGKYGDDQTVVFRLITKLSASLDTGPFTNTIMANYRSSYHDSPLVNGNGPYIVKVNADGTLGGAASNLLRDVPSYTTFDWQLRWTGVPGLTLTGGIKNLFDRKPPLSIQDGGSGNQRGYDPRYTDVFGRTFYVTGNYRF